MFNTAENIGVKHCQWLLLNGCRNSQPHSPPPLSELWRASFARSVALRLFLLAQKKSTDSKTGLQICCTADITLFRLGKTA